MNSTANSPFHVHYWMVDDKEIARQLGIPTDDQSVGDIYIFRPKSVFTEGKKPNVNMNGYEFVSEKILSWKQVMSDIGPLQVEILDMTLNKPILINDARQLQNIAQTFKGVIFLVYCHPSDPSYGKLMKTLCEAREKLPLGQKDS